MNATLRLIQLVGVLLALCPVLYLCNLDYLTRYSAVCDGGILYGFHEVKFGLLKLQQTPYKFAEGFSMPITKQCTLAYLNSEWGTYIEWFNSLPKDEQVKHIKKIKYKQF